MTQRTDGPSAAVRIRVMKRDKFRCTYCGVPGTDAELEIDHIVAVAKGGSHHISNLTTACRSCNQSKGANDAPRQAAVGSILSTAHVLIGKWFHSFEDGHIQRQGQIIGVDGDTVIVQLYDWLTGYENVIETVEKSRIYSAEFKIYPTNELMNLEYHYYQLRIENEENEELRRAGGQF